MAQKQSHMSPNMRFGPNTDLYGPFSKKHPSDVPRWFFDMGIPKVLLYPKENSMFGPKTAIFAPKIGIFGHFWVNFGFAVYLVPVGWLVVSFCARAALTIERLPTLYHINFNLNHLLIL